ncbi:hypothetical protein V498_07353 [Pseudogymnoascus sp. VKM F-4517 (FW-2822)]|nr:hypothetical protein V498_07353 [Pseudogymnoascus sp. VKM F-4517 (FW-2822)]
MRYSMTFAAVAALATVASAAGSARSAVAAYWGQSGGSLRSYCDTADIDYIPIGFINFFPAQGNGWPGSNYASSCWAEYYDAPGYNGVDNNTNNLLLSHCPDMAQDIQYCQSKGKKILLSLGGGPDTYHLTGKVDGEAFADFLWKAYGPKTTAWKGPRPFDPLPGTPGDEIATIVDGYDFDIEHPDTDNSVGYIAMINRLRSYFPTGSNYLITGAPQCVVNDANMDLMIQGAQFDIIFVQYYNTNGCSVRDWVTLNPNYAKTGVETTVPSGYPFGGFSYNAWLKRIQASGSKSKNAKLSIGILGEATEAGVKDFRVSSDELKPLIDAYFCHKNFGGFMLWDAVTAGNNLKNGVTFQAQIKNLLNAREAKGCPGDPVTSTSRSGTGTPTTMATTKGCPGDPVTSTSRTGTPTTMATSTTIAPTTTSSTSTPTTSQPPTYTIIDGTSYPNPPAPTALGSTPKCKQWHVIKNGDTCPAIAAKFEYPNPPAPTALGSTPKCKQWYVIKNGDTCPAIAAKFAVTKTEINLWNTYINMACTNIWANYAVCVSSPIAEDYYSLVGCSTDSQSARSLPVRMTLPNEKTTMTPKLCTDALIFGQIMPQSARSLPVRMTLPNEKTTMTPKLCTDACQAAGYRLAGLEYGSQCFCGTAILNNHGLTTSGCTMPCPGAPGIMCGGSDRMNLYRLDKYKDMGCYNDVSTSRTLEKQIIIPNQNTILTREICQNACEKAGYIYSGVEYTHQCWCGYGVFGKVAAQSSCSSKCPGDKSQLCGGSDRINVMMRPQSRSLGCYSDDVNKRTLRYQMTIANAATLMTPDLCRNTCLTKGFIYSGVEYGKQCFCDDELYGTGAPASGCTMACPGNSAAACGGSSRLNIYSL